MILIADSGSTKTSWTYIDNGEIGKCIETAGINPVRDNENVIKQTISILECLPKAEVEQIFFYGAGCIPPYSTTVKRILQDAFPNSRASVESDMLGAAIALCGHNEGIACILGTGANSCLFDGKRIIRQTPALGFILGDEGSGASLGKRLIGDILKKQLPEEICKAFEDEMGYTQTQIIDRVYRQPQANLFLSSLVPFLDKHQEHPAVDDLITDEFKRFIRRNIRNYNRPDLPVNFVGGITNSFYSQLKKAVTEEGMIMGKTIQKPIIGMAEYHNK